MRAALTVIRSLIVSLVGAAIVILLAFGLLVVLALAAR